MTTGYILTDLQNVTGNIFIYWTPRSININGSHKTIQAPYIITNMMHVQYFVMYGSGERWFICRISPEINLTSCVAVFNRPSRTVSRKKGAIYFLCCHIFTHTPYAYTRTLTFTNGSKGDFMSPSILFAIWNEACVRILMTVNDLFLVLYSCYKHHGYYNLR